MISFVACSVVLAPFVERLSLPHCITFAPLSRSVDYISVDLFLGTLSCSIDLIILPSVPHCLDCVAF